MRLLLIGLRVFVLQDFLPRFVREEPVVFLLRLDFFLRLFFRPVVVELGRPLVLDRRPPRPRPRLLLFPRPLPRPRPR